MKAMVYQHLITKRYFVNKLKNGYETTTYPEEAKYWPFTPVRKQNLKLYDKNNGEELRQAGFELVEINIEKSE